MSKTQTAQEQELKKLEDQAYFELCQIIAEAMQYQDIELLNARITYWKNKYKKILDNPRPEFKKRIEYLLNQYYSSVTQYILNQLKLNEAKKVKNQAKALRELYLITKNTKDLPLLEKKIKAWKTKYPVEGFLDMYQKRIRIYTRKKNLEENAFAQEEAFRDLVDITKKYATLDELKNMVADWDKKYSINNNFSIDDFIKHQSEVKRFISDEFLQSIAREEPKPDNIAKTNIDMVEQYNNKSFSDLSVQSSAYASLLAISKSPNSVNAMFKWVYKNKNIKFNDKYKELILSATYLNYSPAYLNKLKIPSMDMSKNSLSYDEYKNIDDIKRYAIISYFNLLLPPGKAITNDYFTKHIQVIYAKSEKARTTSKIEGSSLSVGDMLNSGVEINLKDTSQSTSNENKTILISDKDLAENIDDTVDSSKPELQYQEKQSEDDKSIAVENMVDKLDSSKLELQYEEQKSEDGKSMAVENMVDKLDSSKLELQYEEQKSEDEIIIDLSEIEQVLNSDDIEDNGIAIQLEGDGYIENDNIVTQFEDVEHEVEHEQNLNKDFNAETSVSSSSVPVEQDDIKEEELDYNTIVAFSPLFITAVNNLDKQATIIDHIDSDVTKYVELEKSQENSLYGPIKIKN